MDCLVQLFRLVAVSIHRPMLCVKHIAFNVVSNPSEKPFMNQTFKPISLTYYMKYGKAYPLRSFHVLCLPESSSKQSIFYPQFTFHTSLGKLVTRNPP